MNSKEVEDFFNIYNTLIESEMVFYYGSEIVPYGKITELEINKEQDIDIEVNGVERYTVDYEEFQENHLKEGMNYHTWQQVREFDNKLEDLIKKNGY